MWYLLRELDTTLPELRDGGIFPGDPPIIITVRKHYERRMHSLAADIEITFLRPLAAEEARRFDVPEGCIGISYRALRSEHDLVEILRATRRDEEGQRRTQSECLVGDEQRYLRRLEEGMRYLLAD